jgi:hypothetical protein
MYPIIFLDLCYLEKVMVMFAFAFVFVSAFVFMFGSAVALVRLFVP